MTPRKRTKTEKIWISINKLNELRSFLSNIPTRSEEAKLDPDYDVHTLKKLVVLAKYLPFFINVLKNKKKMVFIDLLAGSGAVKLKEENMLFPGSAIIGYAIQILSEFTIPSFDFNIFVEKEENKVRLLDKRINEISKEYNLENDGYLLTEGDCNEKIFNIAEILNKKYNRKYKAFIFIDPEGFKEVSWETVEFALKKIPGDFLILFNTRSINRTKRSGPTALASFLGETQQWVEKNITSNEKALEHYKNKIRKLGFNVVSIRIDRLLNNRNAGRMYDLIFASKYNLAIKVMKNIKNTVEGIRTESVKEIIKVITGKQKTILDALGVNNN